MDILTYEPENDIVQLGLPDGTEKTISHREFAANFIIDGGGRVTAISPEIENIQQEAIAVAMLVAQDYERVFPSDPRPGAMRDCFLDGGQGVAGITRIAMHSMALQIAVAAADLARSVNTLEYKLAATAAWVINEAVSLDYDNDRFSRFYRNYMEVKKNVSRAA